MTGLRVVGNQIQNSNGQSVFVHGVNRMGTEYQCIQGGGFGHGPMDQSVIDAMKSWNINAVRVPLNESCWLGINSTSRFIGKPYRDAIVAWVNLITSNNLIAIVDLHWSAAGTTPASGQDPMPNVDHSIDFWRQVANTFKGNSSVIFDLYNEPKTTGTNDQKWRCVRDGRSACAGLLFDMGPGPTTGQAMNYTAVGIQELVDTVRTTGAANVLMAPGIDHSGKIADWANYKPQDPLNNLAVSWHNYNFGSSCPGEACWNFNLGNTWLSAPVILGEFGIDRCDGGAYNKAFMNYMQGKKQGYMAWVWQPVNACGGWGLISANDGTPSAYGKPFRDHIQNLPWTFDTTGAPVPPRVEPAPTPAPPVAPSPSANMLINPGFESGSLSPWTLYFQGGAAGNSTFDTSTKTEGGRSIKVTVTVPKSSAYLAQLNQRSISLIAGRKYTLRFSARAEWDRQVEVGVQMGQAPWTLYMTQKPQLATFWKQFAYTFTATSTAMSQVAFNLAQNSGSVWIDSVSLQQH
ncbi:MAG: cellulase family glycosylhydrolase [Panacagrimonas sp.]